MANYDEINSKCWSICGILDEETGEIRSSLSYYAFGELPPVDLHEPLKRHHWDDPMRWRFNKDGFWTITANRRVFTSKELDLILDHVATKYPGLKHRYDDSYRPWNRKR